MVISIRKIKKRMKNRLKRNTPVKESVYLDIQEEMDIILEDLILKIVSEYDISKDNKLTKKHVNLALSNTTQLTLGQINEVDNK